MPLNWDHNTKGISGIDTDMRSANDPIVMGNESSVVVVVVNHPKKLAKNKKNNKKTNKKSKKLNQKQQQQTPLLKDIPKGLGKLLQIEVTEALIQTRSLDPTCNWLDFQLMEGKER